ncbi:hypothetical protein DSO57_1023829 [Entomophthora muscae]|uniref:Uncharacterized protein n=2 Tax=Entomophthora muscae TaxID=34485 RepID=A0ACC2UMN0_9FUNG|nr:hypothetical protein DSO57_1014183 [Entomophthora muscae]KAJ9088374.1 hypothetical protein DSO57_1023829 [Entomophthora muscae]
MNSFSFFALLTLVAAAPAGPTSSRLSNLFQPFVGLSPGAAGLIGDIVTTFPKAVARAAIDDITNEVTSDESLNKNKVKFLSTMALKSVPVNPEDSEDVKAEIDQIVRVIDDLSAGKSKINFSPFEKKNS